MEKRVLVAVLLSFVVLYAYQAVMPAPKKPVKPKAAAPASAPAIPGSEADASQTDGLAPAQPPAAEAASQPAEPAPAAVVTEAGERQIVVSTSLVRAVFSNRGAVITSWTLKHYTDHQGTPVDLVPDDLPAGTARPFSLRLPDAAATARVNGAIFKSSAPTEIAATDHPVTLTFEYQDQAGLRARKTFRIAPDSYVITFSVDVERGSASLNPAIEWGPGLGDMIYAANHRSFGSYAQPPQAILKADGKVHRLPAAKIGSTPTWQGSYPFVGIDDHYFLASLVQPGTVRVQYAPETLPVKGAEGETRQLVAFEALYATPPKDQRVYFGPKAFDVLKAVDPALIDTIYFGIFQFLAVPLLHALKAINEYVGNYGWSIIILTIFINGVMFPLRHRSVVSMRKMQQLQPQVKAIQGRYEKLKMTDPGKAKMNEELMQLYREKGVNPASGCVPMLLTMPILFAFYAMLSVSIELRGQPFALWIQDLSQHDPYYITPILMGISMLWQQRMTPMADPAQAKVMMITPVMFLVFFLWAPSGLVIYWLMSNLLGIGQQYATNRIVGGPPPRPAKADRRIKQAGTGQTDSARGNGS
jgi:YidC/Oxa1 family membrane protein insertase